MIKTADLIGPALDWAVAKCEGYGGLRRNPHAFDQSLIMNRWDGQCVLFSSLKYSTDWAQGGPILDRERIGFLPPDGNRGGEFRAFIFAPTQHDLCLEDAFEYERRGPTPLIAAMRCFVASHFGNEIEIPEELHGRSLDERRT